MWDAPVGPGPEYCTRNARHVITSEIRSTFGVIYEPFGGGSRGRWREGKSNGGVWETNSWCWFRAPRSPRAIPPRHLARLRPIPWRRGGTRAATWSSWVHIGIYPLTLILLRRSAVLGMNHLFILDLVICIDVHAH